MTCNCLGGNPCPCRRGVYAGQNIVLAEAMTRIWWGTYKCARCEKSYTVNDQWAQCTPDFCHDCYAHLKAQYALVPVDKDGKEIEQ